MAALMLDIISLPLSKIPGFWFNARLKYHEQAAAAAGSFRVSWSASSQKYFIREQETSLDFISTKPGRDCFFFPRRVACRLWWIYDFEAWHIPGPWLNSSKILDGIHGGRRRTKKSIDCVSVWKGAKKLLSCQDDANRQYQSNYNEEVTITNNISCK